MNGMAYRRSLTMQHFDDRAPYVYVVLYDVVTF